MTYNSHPWIMFFLNGSLSVVGGVGSCLKLHVQRQECERMSDVDGQGGWGILKIGQFSWSSYVYYPIPEILNL